MDCEALKQAADILKKAYDILYDAYVAIRDQQPPATPAEILAARTNMINAFNAWMAAELAYLNCLDQPPE